MRAHAERWAPLAISIAALLFSLLYASHYERKQAAERLAHAEAIAARDKDYAEAIGHLKGRMEGLGGQLQACEQENRNQHAYIEDFRLRLTKAGLMK